MSTCFVIPEKPFGGKTVINLVCISDVPQQTGFPQIKGKSALCQQNKGADISMVCESAGKRCDDLSQPVFIPGTDQIAVLNAFQIVPYRLFQVPVAKCNISLFNKRALDNQTGRKFSLRVTGLFFIRIILRILCMESRVLQFPLLQTRPPAKSAGHH